MQSRNKREGYYGGKWHFETYSRHVRVHDQQWRVKNWRKTAQQIRQDLLAIVDNYRKANGI